MARWTRRPAAMLLLSLNGAGLGCAGPAVEPKTPPAAELTPAAPAPAPMPAPAHPAEQAPATPGDSPDFTEALVRLRPAGTEVSLAALEQPAPASVAFANAAITYSTTDVPAMTLIWGMTYGAMAGG